MLKRGGSARLGGAQRDREPTGGVSSSSPRSADGRCGLVTHFHKEDVSEASVQGRVSEMRLSLSPFLS